MEYIKNKDVDQILTLDICIKLMENAFIDLAKGKSATFTRNVEFLNNGLGAIGTMMAFSDKYNVASIKSAGVFPANSPKKDIHQGTINLFDLKQGSLKSVLDMSSITRIRTAASSAVATKYLAKPDAANLFIVGSGIQAFEHIKAILLVRNIQKITLVTRKIVRGNELARKVKSHFPLVTVDVIINSDHIKEMKLADIICLVTNSSQPVLNYKNVPKNGLILAIGASTLSDREVDTKTILNSTVVVDNEKDVLSSSNDILIPLKKRSFQMQNLGTIIQLNHLDLTKLIVYKSVGLAIQDLYASNYVASTKATREKMLRKEKNV